jgi:hypothetical protein
MSLPTKTDLQTLDYAHNGQPSVIIAASSGIDFFTLDIAHEGQPVGGGAGGGAPPSASGSTLQIFVVT